jgi:predicted AAA+ superfamily ATPase
MEQLLKKSEQKIAKTSLKIIRYLLDELHHKDRISIIKGARGVGKTTLLLQYAKKYAPKDKNTLYVSLDDLFFQENTLYDLATNFSLENGYLLLLDEVHKYPNWSRELKLIYDDLPDLKLLVTSSSLLEIYRSESDLSRRANSYHLKELSFREYLIFEKGLVFPKYELNDILENHIAISFNITSKIKPIYEFRKYSKKGMYPYYWDNKIKFKENLLATIHLILEIDLPAIETLDYVYITKLKKLLFAISTSAPFTPNISKLSQKVGISRKAMIKAFQYLERARLILLLNRNNKGISILNKPDKIYINNPNLQYALGLNQTNIGAIRESFFANQLEGLYKINLATKGDFLVEDTYTFEIGGKNKTKSQIKEIQNSFIVRDDFENGFQNYIPLWLFGFLY